MSYQSLARKYRPARFADLIGQEFVAAALQNAMKMGREPRAIIFSGVRGIGKTTTARLYAKLLNCHAVAAQLEQSNPEEKLEPCNRCDSCLAIVEARHEDVLEIDGASHTGVDDVRALQETLSYVPQRSSNKVYIIDEVHMLSQSAFNALLKTLEEPPAHAAFVFATTELQKVPETILSRCQTFHLSRLSMVQITERLGQILQQEGITFDPRALAVVAKEGRGSVRDSLTLLDQVIAVSGGEVTMDSLQQIVRTSSFAPYLELLDSLIQKQVESSLASIQKWDQEGVVFQDAVENLVTLIRNAFIVREQGRQHLEAVYSELGPDELEQLEGIASRAQVLDLNRLFRTMVACRKDLDGSHIDRFILENYLIEWCLDPGLPDLKSFGKHLRQVDSSSSQGGGRGNDSASGRTLPSSSGQPGAQPPSKSMSLQDRLKQGLRNKGKSPEPQQTRQSQPPQVPPKSEAEVGESKPVESVQAPPQLSQVPSTSSEDVASLPKTWRQLVEEWKKQKPLQARLLEETYAETYETDFIKIRVSGSAMAANQLLRKETTQILTREFHELFGFKGRLAIEKAEETESTPRDSGPDRDVMPQEPSHETQAEEHQQLGASAQGPRENETQETETILQARQREKAEERAQYKKDLLNHPLTRETLEAFDGKIRDIVFND